MTTQTNPWPTWLDGLDNTQRDSLISTLIQQKFVSPYTNGHGKVHEEATTGVKIVRQSVEDCMVTNCPPYEDVHNLIPLYNKLAFKENLLVKGPKGNGKTLSKFYYAQESKTPLIIFECSEDSKKRDLFGSFFMGGNETPFLLGAIPAAIEIANEYGRAILAFEEINALTPQVQKELNAVLDFRKMVSMPQIGKTFRLKDGAQIWVVATMNPSVYGGTYELNEDLRSRWDELEIDYPPAAAERRIIKANVPFDPQSSGPHIPDEKTLSSTIDLCIKFAKQSRQQATAYALSSRDVVRLVRDVITLGIEDAIQLCVCKFEGNDRETMILRAKSVFPTIDPKKSWGAK